MSRDKVRQEVISSLVETANNISSSLEYWQEYGSDEDVDYTNLARMEEYAQTLLDTASKLRAYTSTREELLNAVQRAKGV